MGRTGNNLMTGIIKETFPNVQYCHYFNESLLGWADIVISGKRDFREQMASTKRYLESLGHGHYTSIIEANGKFEGRQNDVIQECEMAMKIYNDWYDHTAAIIPLELWFTDPEKYIRDIHKVLGMPDDYYSDEYISGMVSRFQNPVVVGHITKTKDLVNYKGTLTDEEVVAITKFFDENYKDVKDDFFYIETYLNTDDNEVNKE